jgi:hypothetical protein
MNLGLFIDGLNSPKTDGCYLKMNRCLVDACRNRAQFGSARRRESHIVHGTAPNLPVAAGSHGTVAAAPQLRNRIYSFFHLTPHLVGAGHVFGFIS